MHQNTNSTLTIDFKFRFKSALPGFDWLKALKWLLPLALVAVRAVLERLNAGP